MPRPKEFLKNHAPLSAARRAPKETWQVLGARVTSPVRQGAGAQNAMWSPSKLYFLKRKSAVKCFPFFQLHPE